MTKLRQGLLLLTLLIFKGGRYQQQNRHDDGGGGIMLHLFQPVLSFVPPINTVHPPIKSISGNPCKRFCTKIHNAKQERENCEFELQELRVQFQSFLKQSIRPKMLPRQKRQEIERYLGKICRNCPSPIGLKSMADDSARVLYGNWTLVFASENASLGDLPRDSTVQVSIYPHFKCDFKIQFDKSLGLKSLTAKSSYIVDSSPMNAGRVTIIYQDIVFDLFGIKSLPLGFFGLLKGRATFIETIWFDGKLWFERG
eukprot:CAMPEP_0176500566 /NCGR_PEP_ID=MMETSP0200_2-20121128/13631_1 /TAXON_ID=947934 /ORGANISM="Chaetoceros sp., Strain GSL56" /LENGTH=254 /DNA_ID=CAMNT_0017899265 /DNA_START=88 /DNA_END=849 /DNA_ORIENTATION=+